MAIVNTGAVERTIIGEHDANFVRPLSDEIIDNSVWISGDGNPTPTSEFIQLNASNASVESELNAWDGSSYFEIPKTVGIHRVEWDRVGVNGRIYFNYLGGANSRVFTDHITELNTTYVLQYEVLESNNNLIKIKNNVSLKSLLVNRESTVSNTGAVERAVEGKHDANFVRPLGDEELVSNIDVDLSNAPAFGFAISQTLSLSVGKTYIVKYEISNHTQGGIIVRLGSSLGVQRNSNGVYSQELTAQSSSLIFQPKSVFSGTISNVSVKEMLVNRESTVSNTGAVERAVTGVNESDVNSQATIMNLVENSASGAYGNAPASQSLVESPDGTITAVMPTPDSNSDRFEYQISGGTYPTDTKLVYSWYRKRVTTPAVTVYTGDLRVVSLSNATLVGSITQIETDVNGFDRFQGVINITNGSVLSKVRGYFGSSIGAGNSSVAYWGHQLETGTEAREYAPTNGTALFIDNNSTSVVNNTGAVERGVSGVNESDEMFPSVGEELITSEINTTLTNAGAFTTPIVRTTSGIVADETYLVQYEISNYSQGSIRVKLGGSNGDSRSSNGVHSQEIVAQSNVVIFQPTSEFSGTISNVSVRKVGGNRQSTVTNTGAVERTITGVN